MGLSMLGKTLSLLCYAGLTDKTGLQSNASHREKMLGLATIPISLIFGGYMWRDDLRLVGQLPRDFVKGCVRGYKGRNEETNTLIDRNKSNDASSLNEDESSSAIV